MTLNILGCDYTVEFRRYEVDPYFKKMSVSGYCSTRSKLIVVGLMSSFPEFEDETEEIIWEFERETLRHEILHAFLYESGLDDCARCSDGSWAKNEEMIDWFALQGPKIFSIWKEANVL